MPIRTMRCRGACLYAHLCPFMGTLPCALPCSVPHGTFPSQCTLRLAAKCHPAPCPTRPATGAVRPALSRAGGSNQDKLIITQAWENATLLWCRRPRTVTSPVSSYFCAACTTSSCRCSITCQAAPSLAREHRLKGSTVLQCNRNHEDSTLQVSHWGGTPLLCHIGCTHYEPRPTSMHPQMLRSRTCAEMALAHAVRMC